MSIFNIFKNQLGQVIQWENQQENQLWYKYPSKLDEIKDGSKLIVGPGQGAILVYEGKLVNHIEEAGTYNLRTDNHPFITTLVNLRQNFESEHKLLIYFYRKADILNQFWGTPTPIKYLDPTYKIPVELGINGNYSYRISDVNFLFESIIGSKDRYSTEDLREIVSDRIPQYLSHYLAERKYSYLEVDANVHQISNALKEELSAEFNRLGLTLLDFKIIGTQFDENTVNRIGRVADVTIDQKAAEEAGLDYVALEKLRALRDAARNEGGLAGVGAQMGVGMEIGKAFNQEKNGLLSGIENNGQDAFEKLKKLNVLLTEKIITQEEFDLLKAKLLKTL